MRRQYPAKVFSAICLLLTVTAFLHCPGQETQDSSRLNSMALEARAYLDQKKTGPADSIVNAATRMAEKNRLELPSGLLWAKAQISQSQKNIKEALGLIQKAVALSKSQLGPESQVCINNLYGEILLNAGQFSNSEEVLKKNLAFAREKKVKNVIPWCWSMLGTLYEVAADSVRMLDAINNMLNAALGENNLAAAETAASRLGKLRLTTMRDFALADKYYRQSLELGQRLGDSVRIAYTYTNLAWNYYLDKRLDSALAYYERSLTYSIPVRSYGIMANSYGNIGTIYRDMKKYETARVAWIKGIETAKIIKDWYTISWIYEDMSRMAADMGDYRNAYDWHILYKKNSDSLVSKSYSDGLAQARARYETESKEKELQLLSLKLKNQRLLIYGFAGFLLLTLAIGLLLLRQSRQNAKRRISEMDQKILEITQANLRQQMNPHFIFNTLNSIQYYMYKHDKLATNNYLTKFSNLMRKILENSRHTAVPVRDELDALQLYLELESIRFRDKFDYKITVDEEVDPLMYKIPTMLIQPYVENAISHGLMLRPEKGLVTVTISLGNNYLACVIEDNGIGREASRAINQKKQHNHHSLGTHITESRLDLANSIYGTSLQATYTDLVDENGSAAGTRVEIHIPILT